MYTLMKLHNAKDKSFEISLKERTDHHKRPTVTMTAEYSSTNMKTIRQNDCIFKIPRGEKKTLFNQKSVPCETCGKYGDALPDLLQRKTCSSAPEVYPADIFQPQRASLSEIMSFLGPPSMRDY